MKLSRTSWVLLIGGILLIIFASLGFAGVRQLRQQEKLSDDLSVAEQRVAKLQLEQLTNQQEQLKSQLDQANAEFKAAEARLRQPNESINVTDSIFQIAESCRVTIESLSSPGMTTGSVAKINCLVMSLNITATGDVLDLISFIARLNTDFKTGVVKSAEISVPEASNEEDAPSALINLSVYSYEGG